MFRTSLGILSVAMFLPVTVLAGELGEIRVSATKIGAVAIETTQVVSLHSEDGADTLSFEFDVVSDSDLRDSRGGVDAVQIEGDVLINDAENNSTISNNVLMNTTTGGIADANLNSVSGTTVMMQNTGNNVNMNSITQFNVYMKQ